MEREGLFTPATKEELTATKFEEHYQENMEKQIKKGALPDPKTGEVKMPDNPKLRFEDRLMVK